MSVDLLASQPQQETQQPVDLLADQPAKKPMTFKKSMQKQLQMYKNIAGNIAAVPIGTGEETYRMAAKIPGIEKSVSALQRIEPKFLQRPQKYLESLPVRYQYGGLLGKSIADIGTMSAAAEAAPGTLLGQALGGAAGGAAVAPTGHALAGALTGAAGGAIAPYLPKIPGLGLKGIKAFMPKRYVSEMMKNLPKTQSGENVLNELSEGRGVEENAKNLATKVKEAKKTVTKYFAEKYNSLINRAGKESLYDETKPAEKGTYKALSNWKRSPIDTYSTDIRKAHEDFTSIPTFNNSHKLQSVLGDEARQVLKNPFSNLQDRSTAKGWLNSQQKLLNDMGKHLKNVDSSGKLAQEYKDVGEEYKDKGVPYKNKQIAKIARGQITNPRNITTVFKNPEEDIQKVVSDLGEKAPDQILYNELYSKNPTAENILNNFKKLDEKGLQSYIPPQLEKQMSELQKTHAQEEFLNRVGKKPTPEKIIKTSKKLEDLDLLKNLHPSTQENINTLERMVSRIKWAKRGAAGLGLGLLAKEFIPSPHKIIKSGES